MDTTERLHFQFSLSGIGEENGNPLQCSCLENPRDRGAWWAAIYGVAQSQTRLKLLSSSSSSSIFHYWTERCWTSFNTSIGHLYFFVVVLLFVLFVCFFACLGGTSLEKCLFGFFTHFFNWLFFLLLSWMRFS